jgi:hypothetical protein
MGRLTIPVVVIDDAMIGEALEEIEIEIDEDETHRFLVYLQAAALPASEDMLESIKSAIREYYRYFTTV